MFVKGSIPNAQGAPCAEGFVVQELEGGCIRVDNTNVPEFWLEIRGDTVTGRLASGVLKQPRAFNLYRDGRNLRVDHDEHLGFWLRLTPTTKA